MPNPHVCMFCRYRKTPLYGNAPAACAHGVTTGQPARSLPAAQPGEPRSLRRRIAPERHASLR